MSFNSGKGHSVPWRGGDRDISLSGATHFCQQRQKWAKIRSTLRFENPPAPRTSRCAAVRPTRTRQDENHPKC